MRAKSRQKNAFIVVHLAEFVMAIAREKHKTKAFRQFRGAEVGNELVYPLGCVIDVCHVQSWELRNNLRRSVFSICPKPLSLSLHTFFSKILLHPPPRCPLPTPKPSRRAPQSKNLLISLIYLLRRSSSN